MGSILHNDGTLVELPDYGDDLDQWYMQNVPDWKQDRESGIVRKGEPNKEE